MDRLIQHASFLAEEAAEPHLGWGIVFYLVVIWAVIAVFLGIAKRSFGETIFRSWPAQWAEQAYLFIESMCVNVIGAHGRKYVPMMLTLWMLIFTSNVVGLLLPHTPTADWSLNLGLAIVIVAYVQWEGMKVHYDHLVEHGANPAVAVVKSFFMHMRHFAGPKMPIFFIPVTILLFFIEIISELLRMLTLSLRLYGNIHGGHEVRQSLDHLIAPVAAGGGSITIPLGLLVLPLEFLVCIIQAMVFTILSCVYLAIVTAHHDEEEPHAVHADDAGNLPAVAAAQ